MRSRNVLIESGCACKIELVMLPEYNWNMRKANIVRRNIASFIDNKLLRMLTPIRMCVRRKKLKNSYIKIHSVFSSDTKEQGQDPDNFKSKIKFGFRLN